MCVTIGKGKHPGERKVNMKCNIEVLVDEIVAGLINYELARDDVFHQVPESAEYFLTRLGAQIRKRKTTITDPALRAELDRIYGLVYHETADVQGD